MDIADPHDPTARAVRELIALDGGPLVPAALGRALPERALLGALASLAFLEEELNRSSAANGGPAVSVHPTRSTGMRASVRKVAPDHAAVLVPIGVIARLHVMSRLLLGYWGSDKTAPTLLASIRDRPFERRLPRALRPLLDDVDDADDGAGGAAAERRWWQALDALDDAIALDPAFEPDVGELGHLALSLLLSHEFAHVARHHHDIRRRVRAGELAFELDDREAQAPRPATDAELRRAMENDADRIAAYQVVLTLQRQTAGRPDDLPRGFLRLGYALTALLALFDPRRLSLMEFGAEASYPHPLLRHDGCLADGAACAAALGLETLFETEALAGARACLDALRLLEFEVYAERRFCAADEQPEPVLHALRGSLQNALLLARERAAEDALVLRLNTLIARAYGEFRF